MTYKFAATGQWLDRKTPSGPEGLEDGKFEPADVVLALSAACSARPRPCSGAITGNKATDFWGTKRHQDLTWFQLVGAIANGAGEDEEMGSDEVIPIGKGLQLQAEAIGLSLCLCQRCVELLRQQSRQRAADGHARA